MTSREISMLSVLALAILLWATSGLHGVGLAPIGFVAALALVILARDRMTCRAVVSAVEWKLLAFLGATMLLGEALITTGAGAWITQSALARLPFAALASPWVVAGVVAGLALASHAFILSRSARAAILVPVIALPLAEHGYDTAAMALLIVVGTGFCQSTRVSAKPLMIFGGIDRPVFSDGDLIRLSLQLLPLMWIMLVAFAMVAWPALGLEFSSTAHAIRGE